MSDIDEPETIMYADGPDWLDRTEAGELAGVVPRTVDAWVRDGKLTKYLLRGRWPRFKRADVLALLSPAPDGQPDVSMDPAGGSMTPASSRPAIGLFSDPRGVL